MTLGALASPGGEAYNEAPYLLKRLVSKYRDVSAVGALLLVYRDVSVSLGSQVGILLCVTHVGAACRLFPVCKTRLELRAAVCEPPASLTLQCSLL